jgi:MFS family permease
MNKRRLAVLTACFLTVLISYSIRYSYGVLLPEMLPSLAISKTEAGVIYASFFIAYTVFSPLLGLMGDRYNIRWLLTTFTGILGVGTFLMAYASSVTQASLYFIIVGIGSAACWAPVMALAQRWTSDKHRGKTLSFVDIGSALGIVLTSTALLPIVNAQSWRTAWMVLGSLGLAVAVLNFFMIRSPHEKTPEQYPSEIKQYNVESVSSIYLKLLRDRRFWLIGLAYLLTGFAVMVPFTFLTTYATQELAFSYQAATRLVMVIGISAVAGKIALGYLSDRIRRINIMMLCALLIAGGCSGIAYSKGMTLTVFTAIFGIGYGAVWSMYAASASDYFSKKSAGSIIGLWTLYLGIGLTISPIIAGWTADITGTLTWSFILAAAGGIISILFLLPVRRPPQQDHGFPTTRE